MNVYWLEQTDADVPPESDWLSARELVCLDRMRFAKRRSDWRLGRWTAKLLLAVYLNRNRRDLAEIEVLAASSGAPEVYVQHQPAAVTLSLSHRAGTAICTLAPSDVALGCDLEMIEAHSDAFVADYFTREEQDLVRGEDSFDRQRLIALLWSGKESALKAMYTGLRLDTQCVVVTLHTSRSPENLSTLRSCDPHGWQALHVECGDRIFRGWWQQSGYLVRTMVACPSSDVPISVKTQVALDELDTLSYRARQREREEILRTQSPVKL